MQNKLPISHNPHTHRITCRHSLAHIVSSFLFLPSLHLFYLVTISVHLVIYLLFRCCVLSARLTTYPFRFGGLVCVCVWDGGLGVRLTLSKRPSAQFLMSKLTLCKKQVQLGPVITRVTERHKHAIPQAIWKDPLEHVKSTQRDLGWTGVWCRTLLYHCTALSYILSFLISLSSGFALYWFLKILLNE